MGAECTHSSSAEHVEPRLWTPLRELEQDRREFVGSIAGDHVCRMDLEVSPSVGPLGALGGGPERFSAWCVPAVRGCLDVGKTEVVFLNGS